MRRIALKGNGDVPLRLPEPEMRPSPKEVSQAIENGMSPIIVKDDYMEAVILPRELRLRALYDYRVRLRYFIVGRPWDDPMPDKDRLILGYKALCAERDAAHELRKIGTRFQKAQGALDGLAVAIQRNGGTMDDPHTGHKDVVLPHIQKQLASLYEAHVQTMREAFEFPSHTDGAGVFLERCQECLRPALVIDADGVSKYDPSLLTLPGLQQLAEMVANAGEAALAIVEIGITGVIESRKGKRGPAPDLLKAWLVQQGHKTSPLLEPMDLSRLLKKAGIEKGGHRRIAQSLKDAAGSYRDPIRLTIY